MILPDRTLFKILEEGILSIIPLDKEQVRPASVNIRLGGTFSIVEDLSTGTITLKDEVRYKTINTDTHILLPGQFVPATTMEYVSLPDSLAAFMEGRNSLGRLDLFIQNTSWVGPGFQGKITPGLFNANRYATELKAGCRAGQLVFAEMNDIAMKLYNGKYQEQRGATGSQVYMS